MMNQQPQTTPWDRLLRSRTALLSSGFLLFLMLIACLAPWLAPHNPVDGFPGNINCPPAWSDVNSCEHFFLLGTDDAGRDIFSRLIYGSRTSLIVAIIPTIIIIITGTLIGLLAGFDGGFVDSVLMRFADFTYAFPALLLFIVMMFALRGTPIASFLNGFPILFFALSIVGWVEVSRQVRAQVLMTKELAFVEASRALGANNIFILSKHILPHTLSPIIIVAVSIAPDNIITEATLAYLGIGLGNPTDPAAIFPVSWGNMLLAGQAQLFSGLGAQPWQTMSATLAIALTTIAFTFLGDAVRDAFDPRTKSA